MQGRHGLAVLLTAGLMGGCQGVIPTTGPSGQALARIADGQRVEWGLRQQRHTLLYHGRQMELIARRLGLTRLDAEARQSDEQGRRILAEELRVTLDLTTTQWLPVFRQWFRRVGGIRPESGFAVQPVRVAGRSGWLASCVQREAGGDGSDYWRVYLIPQGKSALVLRSDGWKLPDRRRFSSHLDRLVAEFAH